MIGRDKATTLAMKLAEDDPPSPVQKIERIGDVFSVDGGETWTVHLVKEPLDMGDGTIAIDTPSVWVVFVCGRTGRCNWGKTM